MPLSALSNFPIKGANLLYSDYLDNSISLGTLTKPSGSTFLARSNITGTDSRSCDNTTLATAMNSTVDHNIEQIYDTETGASTDWTSQWDMAIRPSTFANARGNELKIKQLTRVAAIWSGTRPQGGIKITRKQLNPLNEIFYRKKFRVPTNMLSILSNLTPGGSLAWMEVDAVKTGVTASTTDQDMRFGMQLVIDVGNGETGIKAMYQCDNGQAPITPIWNGFSAEGSIIPGDEYLQETWIRRPADVNDLVTGRCQTVLTNLRTKERHIVIDKVGGQFWGVRERPFARFYWALCYTGGFPSGDTIEISFAEYELWSYSPYILIPY